MDKRESVEITPKDVNKIKDFIAQNKGRELDALANLVAPAHMGHDDAKKALLMSGANTGVDSVRRKRRINVSNLLFLEPWAPLRMGVTVWWQQR